MNNLAQLQREQCYHITQNFEARQGAIPRLDETSDANRRLTGVE